MFGLSPGAGMSDKNLWPTLSPDGDSMMLKKILLLVLLAMYVSAITGCNTLHGFGEDLEGIGEGIQDAAEQ